MTPTVHTVALVGAWFVLAIVTAFMPALTPAWKGAGALLTAFLLIDLVQVRRQSEVTVERHINANLPIGSWSTVALTVHNTNNARIQATVYDHHPVDFDIDHLPIAIAIDPDTSGGIRYRVKPTRRGDATFGGVDLLLTSPMKLWHRRQHVPVATTVRVYPNFAEVARYTLLAQDNHLSQFGIRRFQRRGEGNDFLQLRDYRKGDTFRQIDWKATARRQKFISREYHDERDQQIVFLMDCGRRMRHLEDGQLHLDQAFSAMLLLSHVATRQGDAVGFLAFAGEEKWVKPRKGANAVNYLLDACYGLHATTEAADYLGVARTLMELQHRRALIMIVSNTRNEDLDDLQQAIALMRRRHLVVLADLQEPGLSRVMTSRITNLDRALSFHSVYDYLDERTNSHERLNHSGAICLDTTARELPVQLVNRYLDIKRTGVL